MLKLSVPDMSCGHCVKAITEAVKAVDAGASVTSDLGSKMVSVDTLAESGKILKSLDQAGYPATVK